MNGASIGERFITWAQTQESIIALVQIGSRVRAAGEAGNADRFSDWDFQVITAAPEVFADRARFETIGIGVPLVFASRGGRLGSARKLTVILNEGELDVVVIPAVQLHAVSDRVKAGTIEREPLMLRALADLAAVLAGGYRILKSAPEIDALYRFVVENLPPPRVSDDEAALLAEGFVCDYVSTLQKIARGELIAAQRWLHHQLAETNFRLLHELRSRGGKSSFPDARRLEQLASADEMDAVSVEAGLDAVALTNAVEKAASSCRSFMRLLVGEKWRWPELPSRMRAE